MEVVIDTYTVNMFREMDRYHKISPFVTTHSLNVGRTIQFLNNNQVALASLSRNRI